MGKRAGPGHRLLQINWLSGSNQRPAQLSPGHSARSEQRPQTVLQIRRIGHCLADFAADQGAAICAQAMNGDGYGTRHNVQPGGAFGIVTFLGIDGQKRLQDFKTLGLAEAGALVA
jgi:hypothetical protein